jgi:hypothetical protein
MNKNQEVVLIQTFILEKIAQQGCESYTSGDCWENDRIPFHKDGAERVCNPCLAKAALERSQAV